LPDKLFVGTCREVDGEGDRATAGVLTIYKNHPVGNFRHKHYTIKLNIAGEGIAIKYIRIS